MAASPAPAERGRQARSGNPARSAQVEGASRAGESPRQSRGRRDGGRSAGPWREMSQSGMKQRWSRLWHGHRRCVTITEPDPTYKVVYLGNVVTQWAKGDDKPLATLWRNHRATGGQRQEIHMKLTVANSGLKAVTKEHGLTEYWASRITHCAAPPHYPRLFCWVFRHEGRRMRPELRCHAVLCDREERARQLAERLGARLEAALLEFRREKLARQKARLAPLAPAPALPRRKQLLSTGAANFRPPLERSKSAPRLTAIDEEAEEDEDDLLLFDEDCDFLTGLESELESTSDLLPEVDSLSDYLSTTDSDSVEDSVAPRTARAVRLAGETLDEEEDTVSDESGYSEETKLSFREQDSSRM